MPLGRECEKVSPNDRLQVVHFELVVDGKVDVLESGSSREYVPPGVQLDGLYALTEIPLNQPANKTTPIQPERHEEHRLCFWRDFIGDIKTSDDDYGHFGSVAQLVREWVGSVPENEEGDAECVAKEEERKPNSQFWPPLEVCSQQVNEDEGSVNLCFVKLDL